MIRLGVCTGAEHIGKLAEIGYDYLEMSLSSVAALTDSDFAELAKKVEASPIKVEAYNGMLPGEVRVTGPNVNATQQHEYLEKAFARAKRLGGRIVVFGSSAARNVPEGFPIDLAWRQVVNFLRLVEMHAANYDITVAIEPLRRKESNIINFVSEAVLLASLHQLPHIRALADTFHVENGHEPLSAMTLAGPMLAHVHTSNALNRKAPSVGDGENYVAIFKALLAGGYDGRVSIEGGFDDFDRDAEEAFGVLTRARAEAMRLFQAGE